MRGGHGKACENDISLVVLRNLRLTRSPLFDQYIILETSLNCSFLKNVVSLIGGLISSAQVNFHKWVHLG